MTFYTKFKRVYISAFGAYIMANSYLAAKTEIIRFREGKISDFDLKYHKINTELDAGWQGVRHELPNNLIFSWFWPVTLPLSTLPYIASKMNPEKVIDQEPK